MVSSLFHTRCEVRRHEGNTIGRSYQAQLGGGNMPWKRYNNPVLRKPNRQEVILILGAVGIGVLAVVAAKVFS